MMKPLPNASASDPSLRAGVLQRAVWMVLSLGIALFAFLVVLGVLLLGLAMATGVMVWALIRGKRPPTAGFRTVYQRARQRHDRRGDDDQIIDAETRVVPESEGK